MDCLGNASMFEDDETALVRELRKLAGAPEGSGTFDLHHGGHVIEVAYTGGSSASLTLRASYDRAARADHPALLAAAAPGAYRAFPGRKLTALRPLAIELRRERLDDVAAKKGGATVEWQSGDPSFDDAIYVSTPTTDAEVLAAVLGPEVRHAVLELHDLGFHAVTIDVDGKVVAFLNQFTQRDPPRPQRGAHAVAAFGRLLSHLPVIAAAPGGHAPAPFASWTRVLGVVGVIGWGTNVGYVGATAGLLQEWLAPKAEEMTVPVLLAIAGAIVAGVLAGSLYGNAVRRRVRGTSLAHARIQTARFSAFGGVSVLVYPVLFIAFLLGMR